MVIEKIWDEAQLKGELGDLQGVERLDVINGISVREVKRARWNRDIYLSADELNRFPAVIDDDCSSNDVCMRNLPLSQQTTEYSIQYKILAVVFYSSTGYQKSRDVVANFYSCPEAPLEAEVRLPDSSFICFSSFKLYFSSPYIHFCLPTVTFPQN